MAVEDFRLNPTQRAIREDATNRKYVRAYLPRGSGKTFLIAYLAAEAAGRGEKVLVATGLGQRGVAEIAKDVRRIVGADAVRDSADGVRIAATLSAIDYTGLGCLMRWGSSPDLVLVDEFCLDYPSRASPADPCPAARCAKRSVLLGSLYRPNTSAVGRGGGRSPLQSEDERRFLEMVVALGYSTGSYLLRSGERSDYYIDLDAVCQSPEGFCVVGRVLCDAAVRAGLLVVGRIGSILGVSYGGIAPALALSAEVRNRTGISWPVLTYRGENGRESRFAGSKGFPPDREAVESRLAEGEPGTPAGRGVLVVDDVATSGGAILEAVVAMREAGYEPAVALCLVDRLRGAMSRIRDAGVPFVAATTLEDVQSAAAR